MTFALLPRSSHRDFHILCRPISISFAYGLYHCIHYWNIVGPRHDSITSLLLDLCPSIQFTATPTSYILILSTVPTSNIHTFATSTETTENSSGFWDGFRRLLQRGAQFTLRTMGKLYSRSLPLLRLFGPYNKMSSYFSKRRIIGYRFTCSLRNQP